VLNDLAAEESVSGSEKSWDKASLPVEKKEEGKDKHSPMLLRILAQHLTQEMAVGDVQPRDIYDFDLALYDCQPATIGGALGEFVFSGRLDNLFSSFCAIEGLARSVESNSGWAEKGDGRINMIALWDNEEIGSSSAFGAESSFLPSTLERLALHPLLTKTSTDTSSTYHSLLARSFLLSSDMGHAVHPSFPSKHEQNHKPMINKGPVLKTNAKMKYASTGETRVIVRRLAGIAEVELQEYEIRNDMVCGSTIGPLVSKTGLRTVDIGCPQLSMHSIREMAGTKDVTSLIRLFETYFERFEEVDGEGMGMLGE